MTDMQEFRYAVSRRAAGGHAGPDGRDGLDGPASDLAVRLGVRTAVLLEGASDLAAVEALAARRGRDLAAEGVCVVSMGGAMSVGRYAGLLGPTGLGLRLTGLCDERERPFFDRGLARAGAERGDVFVCVADLEEELIRALGAPKVEEIVQAEGDLRAWQTFMRQPAHHGRPARQQLRRFLGTKKGRKIRYGRLLVEALDHDQVPAPLDGLLASL
ncbi:TOPRIM nucleotidyl transferase/hydrolase domain-containing protein [Streptomyces sp. NPDC058525]|uniref:TOPRIM nucleotidyl transferase/hydrolase domain-containing protein n=1 Tax=Streptomyces sp. NPDC058525 TaxID=3346538 RepID=UPI0036570295